MGTPTKFVTRSRSMSSRARSASQRYIITSFSPLPTQLSSTGTKPVTWNRGTMRMNTGGPRRPRRLVGVQQPPDGRAAPEAGEGLEDGPVGRHRALRAAGGARRVEDGGVVVRADVDLGQRRARLAPRPPSGRRRRRHLAEPHADGAHAPTRRRRRGSALDPLGVGDQHGGRGVAEGEVELVLGPPGVERHEHRADRQDGAGGHHPLGVVAHADGDAVAGPHPVALDQRGAQARPSGP